MQCNKSRGFRGRDASYLAPPRPDPYVRLSRIRLPPRVRTAKLVAACVPVRVPREPGTKSSACFTRAHSPWSLPFAPPTPLRIAPLCSPASQLL